MEPSSSESCAELRSNAVSMGAFRLLSHGKQRVDESRQSASANRLGGNSSRYVGSAHSLRYSRVSEDLPRNSTALRRRAGRRGTKSAISTCSSRHVAPVIPGNLCPSRDSPVSRLEPRPRRTSISSLLRVKGMAPTGMRGTIHS